MAGSNSVLCALLKLAGLRQIEVARALGVNRSTLAGWLSGYAPMPDATILDIHRLVCSRLPGRRSEDEDRGRAPDGCAADGHAQADHDEKR